MADVRDKYVAAWKKRLAEEEIRRQERLAQARRDAEAMARVLAEEFKARRVWLFGSVATGDLFWAGSDIDLAAEGLDPERWVERERRLEEVTQFPFDVVEMEDATPSLRERVYREGVILHGPQ